MSNESRKYFLNNYENSLAGAVRFAHWLSRHASSDQEAMMEAASATGFSVKEIKEEFVNHKLSSARTFVRKPVPIQAMQITSENEGTVIDWLETISGVRQVTKETIYNFDKNEDEVRYIIHRNSQKLEVKPGNWIAHNPEGGGMNILIDSYFKEKYEEQL